MSSFDNGEETKICMALECVSLQDLHSAKASSQGSAEASTQLQEGLHENVALEGYVADLLGVSFARPQDPAVITSSSKSSLLVRYFGL